MPFFGKVGCASLTLCLFAVSALATPRAPLPAFPPVAMTLFHTQLEAYWKARHREASGTLDYGTLVESFSGYALQRTGKSSVPFVVPALDATGRVRVATDAEVIGFSFKADWTGAAGGGGPGDAGRLVELVAVGDQQTAVVGSLQASGSGSALLLAGPNGVERLLQAEMGGVAGEWHWVVINYGVKMGQRAGLGNVIEQGESSQLIPHAREMSGRKALAPFRT